MEFSGKWKSVCKKFFKYPGFLTSQCGTRDIEPWDDILHGAISSDYEIIVDFFLRFKTNVNYTNLLKFALHQCDGVKCPELLLRKGAKLDGAAWKHESPAEIVFKRIATSEIRKELLILLLRYGLDVSGHRNHHGENLLHAFVNHVTLRPDYQDPCKIAEILLFAGVPLDDVDRIGWSPLLRAICSDRTEMIGFLVNKGADVNKKSSDKKIFPLFCAAQYAKVDLVDLLVCQGADVNAKNCNGDTALHAACIFKRGAVISYLLHKGAEVGVKNVHGKTPFSHLDLAHYTGDDEYSCVSVMVRQFAKLRSFGDFSGVSKRDLKLIHGKNSVRQYYEKCNRELEEMKSARFYAHYSYHWVLSMSRNIRRLAIFTKNREFVRNFKGSLEMFKIYGEDLSMILNEAAVIRT